ncbi:MAG TPA: hypothetical protein VF127_01800 [Nitrospira sp.]|jgi:hypothetical protein
MSVISMAGRRLWTTTVAMGLVIALGYTVSQGATARPAKDVAEQSRAVTASAQYLQGNGFTDPMVSAENIDNRLLTVTVDNKGWTRMSKAQKVEFLERVNGSALSANGGIAIDIHVSMSGAKVATSTFAAGQQSFRLLE